MDKETKHKIWQKVKRAIFLTTIYELATRPKDKVRTDFKNTTKTIIEEAIDETRTIV